MFNFYKLLYCVVGQLNKLSRRIFICSFSSPLSKVLLNLGVLIYDFIKTHFLGKYFMGIQSLNLGNPISIWRIQLESVLQYRISYYLWTRNLVSISVLADCFCWYFAGILFLFKQQVFSFGKQELMSSAFLSLMNLFIILAIIKVRCLNESVFKVSSPCVFKCIFDLTMVMFYKTCIILNLLQLWWLTQNYDFSAGSSCPHFWKEAALIHK